MTERFDRRKDSSPRPTHFECGDACRRVTSTCRARACRSDLVAGSVLRVRWRTVAVWLMAGFLMAAASSCSAGDAPDAAIVPPQTVVQPDCPVSDLLVPSCGAWFGSAIPSADGTQDFAVGLAEYETIAGEAPDIIHFYQRGSKIFPTADQIAAAERPGRQRSLLYFNWKPSLELTWRQIADGQADAAIAAVGAELATYPHKIFFTVHHEPENDVVLTEGSGMTPGDYVDMYRHVVENLRSVAGDRLVFVMVYMGFHRWAYLLDDLYPGDDVVDWIGYDPYGFDQQKDFADLLNRPRRELGWPGFYAWATQKSDKPIMLSEWGVDISGVPDPSAFLRGAAVILEEQFPEIKALVYWNSSNSFINARLDQESDGASRFATAFAQLAADPYFSSSSTADAP